MEYEVDSYTLEHININGQNKYYLSFKDSVDQDCKIVINKEIFDAYMTSRKAYTKIKNETSRHLEHLPLSEIEIYRRSFYPSKSTEETVIKNLENERVHEAMKQLTEVQNRRIELHIINKITIREVARLENVKKRQIEKSLNLGLKKLRKILKDRGGQN